MPHSEDDIAARLAQRALGARGDAYAGEVRRLLDAGLDVMRRCGTGARPRVADIVAAAGLSNDAFYRHFSGKDALVSAILDDGTERLARYLAHVMAKEAEPAGQVRRWVEGVLSQAADEDVAAATLAVLWNAGNLAPVGGAGPSAASAPLAALLVEPFAALGSAAPDRDAALVGHAVVGALAEHLWHRRPPTPADVDHVTAFCLRAATPGDLRSAKVQAMVSDVKNDVAVRRGGA